MVCAFILTGNMKQLTLLFFWTCCFAQFIYGQYLVPTLDKTTSKYGYKEKDKIEWRVRAVVESLLRRYKYIMLKLE